jgi:hypothetical protein
MCIPANSNPIYKYWSKVTLKNTLDLNIELGIINFYKSITWDIFLFYMKLLFEVLIRLEKEISCSTLHLPLPSLLSAQLIDPIITPLVFAPMSNLMVKTPPTRVFTFEKFHFFSELLTKIRGSKEEEKEQNKLCMGWCLKQFGKMSAVISYYFDILKPIWKNKLPIFDLIRILNSNNTHPELVSLLEGSRIYKNEILHIVSQTNIHEQIKEITKLNSKPPFSQEELFILNSDSSPPTQRSKFYVLQSVSGTTPSPQLSEQLIFSSELKELLFIIISNNIVRRTFTGS